eukprot:PhM_4_TR16807/c0_g1_i1/m.52046
MSSKNQKSSGMAVTLIVVILCASFPMRAQSAIRIIMNAPTWAAIEHVRGCRPSFGVSETFFNSVDECIYGKPQTFTITTYGLHNSVGEDKYEHESGAACTGNYACSVTFVIGSHYCIAVPQRVSTTTTLVAAPSGVNAPGGQLTVYVYKEEYNCTITATSSDAGQTHTIKANVNLETVFLTLEYHLANMLVVDSNDDEHPATVSFMLTPAITSVSGCNGDLTNCPTRGTSPLYISIKNSGVGGVTIGLEAVGGATLDRVATPLSFTYNSHERVGTVTLSQYAANYTQSGFYLRVLKYGSINQTNRSFISSTDPFLVNFRRLPIITQITGCTVVSSREVSNCLGGDSVVISGEFLAPPSGVSGTTTAFLLKGGGTRTPVAIREFTSQNVVLTLPATSGTHDLHLDVAGENSVPVAVSFRPTCPANCGGHGTCNNGACVCHRTATEGFWAFDANASCTVCATNFYGVDCRSACSCGSGSCNDGLNGNGACLACPVGYAGPSCTLRCPTNSQGAQCNGQGTCYDGLTGNASCACSRNYDEPTCMECKVNFWGSACGSRCPTDSSGSVCSGKGRCFWGISGVGDRRG